jgi:hypothetical protein
MIRYSSLIIVVIACAFTSSASLAALSNASKLVMTDNPSIANFTLLEVEAIEAGTGTNVAAQSQGASASATSAGHGGTPDGAIDGDTSAGCCGQLWHGTTAGTSLTIDLSGPKTIEHMNFYARQGCCGQNRAGDFVLDVKDAGNSTIASHRILGVSQNASLGAPVSVNLDTGATTVNVALGGKPTTSSGQAFGGSAAKGADGNIGGNSWVHSNTQGSHFWEIDLQGTVALQSMAINGRGGLLGRINGSTVQLKDHTGAIVGTHTVNATTNNIDIVDLAAPLNVRSVRIQNNNNDWFNFMEFQAFAENVALGKPTTQSSNWGGFDPNGRETTDGILGNISHTANGDQSPTHMVNLEGNYALDSIMIHNRDACCSDRLSNIQVELLDADMAVLWTSSILNAANALGSPAVLALDFHELTGAAMDAAMIRVSKLNLAGGGFFALSIGELQAFGQLSTSVPEPATATLALLGLGGLMMRRKRQA